MDYSLWLQPYLNTVQLQQHQCYTIIPDLSYSNMLPKKNKILKRKQYKF